LTNLDLLFVFGLKIKGVLPFRVPYFFYNLALPSIRSFMGFLILVFLCCYLLGSIPAAVWTGKLVYGVDIRTKGSGNAGATNTFRVLGKKAGVFVLIFDILKGFVSTNLARPAVQQGLFPQEEYLFFALLFGLATVAGHIYPVFAGFRGGKGVATLLGMVFAVSWEAGLICVGVFLLLFTIFHFVSVGSMVGGLVFSVLLLTGFCGPASPSAMALSVFLSMMLLYTHRSNIEKLRKGTENKMYLYKSKSVNSST
jgi:glycerol-3-phosphate acyltransferase PlsY